MKTKIILASSLLVLASSAAFAQDKPVDCYLNGGITANDNDGVKTTSLSGKIGYNINKNFAVEAEGGLGIDGDTVSAASTNFNVSGKYTHKGDLGAYAVGKLPMSENFSLLGRVGYHHVWDQVKVGATKYKGDDGSFAAGVGAQYMFDDSNGVRADYTRYTENDGMDNFSVSYVRKF